MCRLAVTRRCGLVVPVCAGMAQCRAGRAVGLADVPEPPADLGDRVGTPVRSERRHLVAGQRLRDAVGAGARVARVGVPAALTAPQSLQAAPLTLTAALAEQQRMR